MRYLALKRELLKTLSLHHRSVRCQMDVDALYSSAFQPGLESRDDWDMFKHILQDLHNKSFIWVRFAECKMISATITPLGEEYLERLQDIKM